MTLVTTVRATGLIDQLADELVVSYSAENLTIAQIVTALLGLQMLTPAITVGTIDPVVSRSISIDGDTILRALYRLRDTVGGDIYVDNNRALQWRTAVGEDKGQQVRYRKNLHGITRDIEYATLANRIYAFGAGEGNARIKLSDAAGQAEDYVEDTDSQTEWSGIYITTIVDRSITHPDTLLAWANLKLADLKNPRIAYEVDTIDFSEIEGTDLSFDALRIGSTITIIDEDLDIDVSARVVRITRPDLLHPERMKIEVANRIRDITDILGEVYDTVQLGQHTATEIGAGQVIVKGAFTVIDWVTDGQTTIVGSNIETGTITANQIAADTITANEIAANTITAAEILADTITAAEIAANTITAAEILADTITATEIAANTITAAEIAAGVITATEIAAGTITADEIQADTITADQIAADTITAAEIAANTITASEIAANTITAAEIEALTITSDEIAAHTITAEEIEALTITAAEIKADTITAAQIAANTITAAEIAAGVITATEIAADTITANEIAADTITADQIAADTITADEIAADTITADEILANTITAAEIAANTITAAEIAAGVITAAEIAANTITAAEILADTITAAEIAADTITAAEIAANTITAAEIAAGTITAVQIAALTITSDEIEALTITADKIAGATITADKLHAEVLTVENILVSGVIYLSDWAHAVDPEKLDGGVIYEGSIDKAGLSFVAFEKSVDTLDDMAEGATYERVLATDITAGHVLLSSVTQSSSYRTVSDANKTTWNGKPDTMDEIGEGGTYKRVKATDISAGHVKLSDVTVIDGEWYRETGVVLDATKGIGIFGGQVSLKTYPTEADYNADTNVQCYIGTDGHIYAGGGLVGLSADGIDIIGDTVGGAFFTFREHGGAARGYILHRHSDDVFLVVAVSADLYLQSGAGKAVKVGNDLECLADLYIPAVP